MKEAIKTCEKWIEDDSVVSKDIKIVNEKIIAEIENGKGVIIKFSIHIGKLKNDYEEEFLNLINKLTKHHVENRPF